MISIELNLENNEKMLVSTIYRSLTAKMRKTKNNFNGKLGSTAYKHLLVLGDFNRKDIKWDTVSSTSKNDNEFIDAIRDTYLTQDMSSATRGGGTDESSLVDLVFTSNEQNVESITLDSPQGKSDHSIIKLVYRLKPEMRADRIVCDYERADFEKMKKILDIDGHKYFRDCKEDIDILWKKS